MKAKSVVVAVACLFFGSTSAFADVGTPRRMLALDVGHFLYSLVPPSNTVFVPLEYEGAISNRVTLFAAPRLALRSGSAGLGLGLGARFYLINAAISGLWLGPEVGLLYAAGNTSGVAATLGVSLGGGIGWNFILGDSLVLSPGVNIGVAGLGGSTVAFDFSPRVVVGYAF